MLEPLIIRVMREFKRALLTREAARVNRLVRAWMRLDRALEADIEALAEEIALERAAGQEPSEGKLLRKECYVRLLAQVRAEIARYEGAAERLIRDGQAEMVRLGVGHAQAVIRAGYETAGVRGHFDRLPVEAVEYMVGSTADGGPLFGVLERRALAPDAVEGLTEALIDATARGWNPRKSARAMQDGLAQGLQKALVIARTEQLRVYRVATDAQYRASGVVQGKRRLATRDTRTCLACLAMDGEYIPLDKPMYDHPQGRCTAVPILDGLPDVDWQRGPEWFASLSSETQRAMMGPKRYAAWRQGDFAFRDLATVTEDPVWGSGLRVTPAYRLVGASA